MEADQITLENLVEIVFGIYAHSNYEDDEWGLQDVYKMFPALPLDSIVDALQCGYKAGVLTQSVHHLGRFRLKSFVWDTCASYAVNVFDKDAPDLFEALFNIQRHAEDE